MVTLSITVYICNITAATAAKSLQSCLTLVISVLSDPFICFTRSKY